MAEQKGIHKGDQMICTLHGYTTQFFELVYIQQQIKKENINIPCMLDIGKTCNC